MSTKKQKNKNLTIAIILIIIVTYFAISILPELIVNRVNTNTRGIIQVNNNIDLSNSKASIDTITKTDKVYYLQSGAVPTNRVWSSAVFKGELQGLYTYPFASRTQNGYLQVSLPNKQVYERLITAQIAGEVIGVKAQDLVDKVYVESFDDISVTLLFKGSANQDLFTATYVQGSPYIFIYPKENNITIDPSGYTLGSNNGSWIYTLNDKQIGVFSNGNANVSGNSLNVTFDDTSTGYITLALVDGNNFDLIKQNASNLINSATSEYKFEGDKILQTYKFNFRNGATTTIFGLLPHQYQNGGFDTSKALFKMNTLRGDQYFFDVQDSQITYQLNRSAIADEIVPENLSQSDKDYLADLIEKDLKGITFIRPTTYFGGNDILKLARLLQLADISGNTSLFNRIKDRLYSELSEWYTFREGETNKYFAYDKSFGGIMSYETGGFGEEKYNDHHFQYGYFIHASAILAGYDSKFVEEYGDIVNLLVKDIANNDKSDPNFPYRRYFDVYEGHSWATGYADSTDGNNQESSSEAINAWYGTWLWSKVTENTDLQNLSEYLFSSEINSTRTYWLNWYNNKSIFPDEYKRNKASLVYGGKVEYQTFFSLEPQSIEAIQYLPITPGSLYLYNSDVLNRDYNFFKDYLKDTNAHLNDFNYLYYTMIKGFDLFTKEKIEKMQIDEGQSRANVYYWTLFWNRVSGISQVKQEDSIKYEVTYKNNTKKILD